LSPRDSSEYTVIAEKEYGLTLNHFSESFYEKQSTMGRPKDSYDYQKWKPFSDTIEAPVDLKSRLMYYQLPTKKESVIIKPGLEELFDSDFELANQVYEALGFKPKATNVVYSAVFFDTNDVVSKYKQVHPNLYSHHSTIEFKPSDLTGLPIGQNKEIKIVGRLTTDKIDVLLVDNPLSKNRFPHITLSTAKGVKPFESNEEIQKNLDKVQPLTDTIQGTVGVFDGNNEVFSSITPEQKQQALQAYSQYLDTIFPDSQVKNIVYHKTSSKQIEGGKFKISRLGGVYFSFFNIPTGGLLKGLFQKIIKENTVLAVVNVKNPFIVNRKNAKEVIKKTGLTTQDVTKLRESFDLSNNDAVLGFPNERKDTGQLDNFPNISFNENERKDIIELAVFEPEQIHMLGTEEDIEDFKQFLKSQPTATETTMEPSIEDQLEDFIEENPNMPEEDAKEYFLSCKL
jgi:hypothetical protein